MKLFQHCYRILYINLLFLRYRLDYRLSRGIRFRKTLEQLGPIFVKFGQLLSTRYDALPQDILKELEQLQDKVPPFSSQQAIRMVTESLNMPLESVFQSFETIPLASASIAQVHAAKLLNGKNVVVKILRPNIHAQIKRDVALLKIAASLMHRFWKKSRQFKPKEFILEIERFLNNEIDLLHEAANASQLKRNFHNNDTLYIPEIYWEHSTSSVLVMERLYGIPVSNLEALKKNNVNLKQLAERGVELFFTQVFRDCFFHADLHPGNIWVADTNSESTSSELASSGSASSGSASAKFLAMDFGIMGSLSPYDQRYLAENFLAFFKRDYRRVAELHVQSGWVPQNIRVDEFESAIRRVCEPIFEKPLRNISFAQMLMQLFKTASTFRVVIQPQFLLLQKTLLNVESMARKLYPELDLWSTAKPFLENWVKSQIGVKAFLRKIKEQGPYLFEKLPELPNLIYASLSAVSQSQMNNVNKPGNDVQSLKNFRISLLDLSFGIFIGILLSFGIIYLRSYFNG